MIAVRDAILVILFVGTFWVGAFAGDRSARRDQAEGHRILCGEIENERNVLRAICKPSDVYGRFIRCQRELAKCTNRENDRGTTE